MKQEIAQFALVVADYDEAIRFYTEKLHFTLVEDTPLSPTKRWVRIAPPGSEGCKSCWPRLPAPNNSPG